MAAVAYRRRVDRVHYWSVAVPTVVIPVEEVEPMTESSGVPNVKMYRQADDEWVIVTISDFDGAVVLVSVDTAWVAAFRNCLTAELQDPRGPAGHGEDRADGDIHMGQCWPCDVHQP